MLIEDTDSLGRTLQQVAQRLNELQVQHDEHLTATKGRFNLFTVLLEENDETRLHSRYLAHLLDPKGPHDCADQFLKLFLKILEKRGVQPHEDAASREKLKCLNGQASFPSENVTVRCEVPFAEGRLDILIESPGWGAIAIENKIWAPEQDQQIERYATYLEQYDNHVLLYLTLDGKESQTASGYKYYRISYGDHILKWLEECLRATYAHVNLNQALQQYKNVVCKLVGRPTLEIEYMEKMKEVVRTHPDIVANWSDLKQAVEQLRDEYRKKLLDELKIELDRQDIHLEPTKPGGGSNCLEWFARKQPTDLTFGKSGTPVKIRIQANWSGVVGLWLVNGVDSDSPEMPTFFKVVQAATEQQLVPPDDWRGGSYSVSDGDCLTDEELAQLLEQPEKIREIVSRWVSRISKYVDAIESVCNQGIAGMGSTPQS